MRIRMFAVAFLLTEGFLIGYAVGKNDLDKKAASAIKAGATEFIAFAKSVPPAIPEGYRRPTAAEVRAMSDAELVAGKLPRA
jgi:hypothetical protein